MASAPDWITAIATMVLAFMAFATLISMFILSPRHSRDDKEIPLPHSSHNDEEIGKLLRRVKGLEDQLEKQVKRLDDENRVHYEMIETMGRILLAETEADES